MNIIDKLVKQSLAGDRPKWCDHVVFWSRPASSDWDGDYSAAGGWSYRTPEAPCGLSANKWKFCPICGTKNPYN